MGRINWVVRRYCFRCESVQDFYYCDNCGKRFCVVQGKKNFEYGPYHETCL